MSTCPRCGEEPSSCPWECRVAGARADGAVDHRPNGLPVGCITSTGLLLECEHGDHRDYKFPVEVTGPATEMYVNGEGEEVELPSRYPEQHALIYTDGCVALTLYECCYFLWHLATGEPIGGSIQSPDERLSPESCAKVRAAVADERSEGDGTE